MSFEGDTVQPQTKGRADWPWMTTEGSYLELLLAQQRRNAVTCVKGRVHGEKRQHQYPCIGTSSSICTDHTCCGTPQFRAVLKRAHDPWWGSGGPESSPSPPFPSFCPVLPLQPPPSVNHCSGCHHGNHSRLTGKEGTERQQTKGAPKSGIFQNLRFKPSVGHLGAT